MVDVLVEVIGGDEMALLLIEDAALIQAVQPDVAGDVLICEEAADAERTCLKSMAAQARASISSRVWR